MAVQEVQQIGGRWNEFLGTSFEALQTRLNAPGDYDVLGTVRTGVVGLKPVDLLVHTGTGGSLDTRPVVAYEDDRSRYYDPATPDEKSGYLLSVGVSDGIESGYYVATSNRAQVKLVHEKAVSLLETGGIDAVRSGIADFVMELRLDGEWVTQPAA